MPIHLSKIIFVENDHDMMPRYVVENHTVQLLGSLAKHSCVNTISSFIVKNTAIVYNVLSGCRDANNAIRNSCIEVVCGQQSSMFPNGRHDQLI